MTKKGARQVDWYFDFISPYAWLQAESFHLLPSNVVLTCKPVLFAGLLQHWGQLGPAEIVPKRRFTYRYIVWRARAAGAPAVIASIQSAETATAGGGGRWTAGRRAEVVPIRMVRGQALRRS